MSGSAIVLRSPLRLIGRMASRGSGLIQRDVPEQVIAPALGGATEAQAQREVRQGLGAVRSPFRRLQGMQQVTMLSHPLWPPRATGITWSKVSWRGGRRWPQYWQR